MSLKSDLSYKTARERQRNRERLRKDRVKRENRGIEREGENKGVDDGFRFILKRLIDGVKDYRIYFSFYE